MIPTVLPHSTVLAQRRPDPRGPSSRVRLTVEALEALLAVPDRFQRIDFGDGKGHLFKKSTHSDKNRFPNGEFFAAKINDQGNILPQTRTWTQTGVSAEHCGLKSMNTVA